MAGSTLNSSGTYSLLLSKYNGSGVLQWSSTFTVNTAGDVYAGAIIPDLSGNIFITGAAYNGSTNGYDLYVTKFNASGTKLWHQLYNGAGNSYDGGTAIAYDVTNNYVYVTGGASQSATNIDVVTICYNSSGTAQWTQTWNNASLYDFGGGVLVRSGNKIRVTGFTQVNATTWEYVTLQYRATDGLLNVATTTSVGGTVIDQINATAFDTLGNVYITGAMGTSSLDIKTVKLNAQMAIAWTVTYNGSAGQNDVGRGIVVDAVGNVYVAGYTTTASGRDAVLIKYSSSGIATWVQTYDGGSGDDEFADLAITADASIFVGGYTTQQSKDFYAAFYSTAGVRKWSDSQNGLANRDDKIQQVVPDGFGNFIVSGSSQTKDGQEVMNTKYVFHSLVIPDDEAVVAPFVAQHGQKVDTDGDPVDSLRYYNESMYPSVYLFDDKVSYVFAHIDTSASTTDTMARVDLSFYVGGSPSDRTPPLGALDKRDAFYNYYLGHIPEGRERVPLQDKVLAPDIYPGIDAIYGQGEDGLFIHLVCQPGSDPDNIVLQWMGATGISVPGDSNVIVQTLLEDLVLPRATASVISSSGVETSLSWYPAYKEAGSGQVAIDIGAYDESKTLVIKIGRGKDGDSDCNTYWSTYFGHNSNDAALGSDVDDAGFMYFTGRTQSALFPTTPGLNLMFAGSTDVFATRFRQLDIFDWGTFYGGNEVNTEVGYAIKWGGASNNNVYFAGRTSATDFPLLAESGYFNNTIKSVANGMKSRGFMVKLNAQDGSSRWSTFFGDAQKNNDAVTALMVTAEGNVVVGGYSFEFFNTSTAFPFFPSSSPSSSPHVQTSGGMFLAEFDSDNNQVWATRLGNGDFAAGTPNQVADISERAGEIYITGTMFGDASTDFIPTGPNSRPFNTFGSDAFIIRFSQARAILWSTYLGGNGNEYANSIVCRPNGGFYITGTTLSDVFPVQAVGDASDISLNDLSFGGAQFTKDIYVCRFSDEEGSSCLLRWARYLGGPGSDVQGNVDLPPGDARGTGNAAIFNGSELIVTGGAEADFEPILKSSSSCPYYYDVVDRGLNSNGLDALITVFNADNKITFSTYWGGASAGAYDTDFGNAIATGTSSNGAFLLLGGYTRSKSGVGSQTIPVCYENDPDYYEPNLVGGFDAFISKIYYGSCTSTTIDVVEQMELSQRLDIWPNPVNDLLQIRLHDNGLDGLALFDATGKDVTGLIKITNTSVESSQAEIGRLLPGLYWLRVRSGTTVLSGKFIKI